MLANPMLLQKKYTRIVELFAQTAKVSLDEALEFFYHSNVYLLMKDGISDMHCMSDGYLVEDLMKEYKVTQTIHTEPETPRKNTPPNEDAETLIGPFDSVEELMKSLDE